MRIAYIVWLTLVIVVAIVGVIANWLGSVRFAPFNVQMFTSTLVPLVVVAVLIERFLEVFFGIFRKPKDRELEAVRDTARSARLAAVQAVAKPSSVEAVVDIALAAGTFRALSATFPTEVQAVPTTSDPNAVADAAAATEAKAEGELAKRAAETTRIAFLAGGSVGVLVALCGVRLMETMLATGVTPGAMFKTMDILLTGALLGGGADGIHKVVEVVTKFLELGRKKSDAAIQEIAARTR